MQYFKKELIDTSQLALTVKAKVLDMNTGLPIPNVNVYNKHNTKIGTITDANGNFSLSSMAHDILVFSHLSYGKEEYKAGEIKPTVYLMDFENQLDEVVLTPGTPKPKKSKTSMYLIGAIIGAIALYSSFKQNN